MSIGREIPIDTTLKRMLLSWLQHGIDEAQYKELSNKYELTEEELNELIEGHWAKYHDEHCESILSQGLCKYNSKASI